MTKIAQQGQDITPIGKTSTENFEENEEEEVRSKIPNYSRLRGPGLFRCYSGLFNGLPAFFSLGLSLDNA
jgi:hypothetical protein